MINKYSLGFIALFFFNNFLALSQNDIFEGTWKVEGKNMYESWTIMPDQSLRGLSYKFIDDKQIINEFLSLTYSDNDLYYSALVPDQNQGNAIPFKAIKKDSSIYHFNNPDHDFPNHIIYTFEQNKLKAQVLNNVQQGFTLNFEKIVTPSTLPEWFIDDVQRLSGNWTTDNSKYKSENEKFDTYIMTWKSGLSENYLFGTLSGISESGDSIALWQMVQYWDDTLQKAIVLQFGQNNIIGQGNLFPVNHHQVEIIQTASMGKGIKYLNRHTNSYMDNNLVTESFILNDEKKWIPQRKYIWIKD